jgi:heme oxygenase
MSNDRVPERPNHMCSEFSCPLLGVMSESTRGGDWYCFAHVQKEASARQEITADLDRMEWLTTAVSELRMARGNTFRLVRERIAHDLEGNRALLEAFNKTSFIALENEISHGLREAAQARRLVQMPLPA